MALAARFNHTVRGPVFVSASLRTSPSTLGPFQLQNFPLSATRQKNQSDYVGRMLPGRPFIDQPIQRTVKPVDFLGGQKASEFRAGVSLDALRRVGGDQAGRDGGIQDLAKQLERLVRAFGCCPAVDVEPSLHKRTTDPIQPKSTEGGQELFRQHAVDRPMPRSPPSDRGRCFPLSQGVFPKQRSFRFLIRVLHP